MKKSYLPLVALLALLPWLPGCCPFRHSACARSAREFDPATVTFASWSQGEPPKRLIRSSEGFCALTSVTGHFQGGGEIVKVYVDDDGFWYLGGGSMQEGVSAQCIIVRYQANR